MKQFAARLLLGLVAAALTAMAASAFETNARAAYILDQTTGTVLLAKNADMPLPPASMSKLMTLYVTFEAIRDGRLSLAEKLPVSKHAMSYGGSTMFLDTTDRVVVEDLLRGIIVLSGNDACAVLAEALSPDGSEAGFARYMTQRAVQMGMTNSTFVNASGWPAPGHRMSMRDLALLANRIITDFPEYYPMFAEMEFKFDGRAPQNINNRNPLLGLGIGADGLKTGHTAEAGYGLVGSAVQGNRRVIFVISGLESADARAREAEAIVNWAFRQFAEKTVVEKDKILTQAPVWMGDADKVGLVTQEDVRALLPVMSDGKVAGEIVYQSPVPAPVTKGDPMGELIVRPEGLEEMRVPLIAASDVGRGGFAVRVRTVAGILLDRLNEGPEGAF